MRLSALVFMLACTMLSITACGGKSYKLVESGPGRPSVPARVIVTDFQDERSFDRKLAAKPAPFSFTQSYFLSRPEDTYSSLEDFPAKMAKSLAENLAKGGHFESVQYVSPDEIPEPGSYDLKLTGALKETTMRGTAYYYGLVLPLGFQLSKIPWHLGAPKLSRRYDLAMDIQMYDGYTGKPIGEPIKVSEETDGKSFTVYADEGKLNDLNKKVVGVWNQYIEGLHAKYPTNDAQYWASIRSEGEKYLADAAREQALIKRGSPPVFTFISPTNDSTVREETTTIRWSLTAPNGLKSVAIAANNESIETGVRTIDLSDPDNAPRGISARDSKVPLKMGTNLIEARVSDHRGNNADAQLEITRLPRALLPAKRYAILIGMGSEAASATARDLERVLTDPVLGQFNPADVNVLASGSFNADQVQSEIREIGPKARAGELVFVYVAAPGDAASGTLGGNVKLSDFVQMLQRNLATEEVVLVLDVDWSGQSDDDVLELAGSVPSRWAVAISSLEPKRAIERNGRRLFGATAAEIISGRNVNSDNLTLERMLDLLSERAEQGGAEPEISGRYNPNITMAEFK